MHSYTPFFTPLPIWNQWWILLFPLVICISVAYKGIKCDSMRQVLRRRKSTTFQIRFPRAAAVGLSVLAKVLEKPVRCQWSVVRCCWSAVRNGKANTSSALPEHRRGVRI